MHPRTRELGFVSRFKGRTALVSEAKMISQPINNYEVLEQYHSQPRNLKIIHVGAGASGLLLAYKAERWLRNYDLVCYEK